MVQNQITPSCSILDNLALETNRELYSQSAPYTSYTSSSIPTNTLILTSSGGQGHKSAAYALRDKIVRQIPSSNLKTSPCIEVVDVLLHGLGKRIGLACADLWNQAQQKGNLKKLTYLANLQWVADYLFFTPIFTSVLLNLAKSKSTPIRIINTQVIGLAAITSAVWIYNKWKHFRLKNTWKDLTVEIFLTDCPEKAFHFFQPIKRLPNFLKKLLIVNSPALGNQKDSLPFISNMTRLKKKQICILRNQELPVNPVYQGLSMHNGKNIRDYAGDTPISIRFDLNAKQKDLLSNILNLSSNLDPSEGTYSIDSKDTVYSLILGSQPTSWIVKNLVEEISTMHCDALKTNTLHCFVLCGRDDIDKLSLFQQTCSQLIAKNILSKQLKVVPLPFQNPEIIAQILARSNVRIVRSGGGMCFELKSLYTTLGSINRGKTYIMCETKGLPKDFAKWPQDQKSLYLISKVPLWEQGNLHNLMHSIDAQPICPQTLPSLISREQTL